MIYFNQGFLHNAFHAIQGLAFNFTGFLLQDPRKSEVCIGERGNARLTFVQYVFLQNSDLISSQIAIKKKKARET